MNNLKLSLVGLCVFALLFVVSGCASQPTFCPELTVKFCPVK